MKTMKIVFLYASFLIGIAAYAQEVKQSQSTYLPKGSLSLRTNTVPWLLLTPNIGLEYKVSDDVGLIADGAFAHWSLNTTNKYWHIWDVSPQVRYYAGHEKSTYIGGKYMMGEYNLTGNQGSYMGGGLTLGRQFNCGHNLMVDLGLSLGYLYLYDKEKYNRINGANVRDGAKTSNGYWGPIGANVSFVWKIN
jgi:hypothetical protein